MIELSWGIFGMGLFAFGEGLFAEFDDGGDERVNIGEAADRAAGGSEKAVFEQALDRELKGFFGVAGFGGEVFNGFLVLGSDGLVFGFVEALAKEVESGF